MGARLVNVFVINLEKDKLLCYKQIIATMFEVHRKVKFFQFCWSHQHTHSVTDWILIIASASSINNRFCII